MRRVAAVLALLALAAAAVLAAVTWQPPDPAGCVVLLEQAEHQSDTGVLLHEAGCDVPDEVGRDLTARP